MEEEERGLMECWRELDRRRGDLGVWVMRRREEMEMEMEMERAIARCRLLGE
jgi:hypothetical protein